MNTENIPVDSTSSAVSIYGQSAAEEFPILKTFQQYIDAEQSRARKRMIGLCVFFAVLMTIVISLFVFMLHESNRDKQATNDQFIKMLLAERESSRHAPAWPAAVPVQQVASGNEAALKAATEALAALQKKISEEHASAASPVKPTAAEENLARQQLEFERRMNQENERMRKVRESLESEKRRIADEREKLRLEEVERQRRRLYPEYYAQKEKESARPAAKSPALSQSDIDEILAEADAAREAAAAAVKREYAAGARNRSAAAKPVETVEKPAVKPVAAEEKLPTAESDAKKSSEEDDGPIEYFTDGEYSVPVKVNGKSANWSIGI